MSKLVQLDTQELDVIEKSKALEIKKTFEPMVKMLEGFEEAYSDVIASAEKGIDEDLTKRAKRLRLDIAKIRIEADKARKAEKEEYLRAGQAIQGVFNILKWAVTDREEKLQSIEKHFEIQEQKRLEALQAERVELLDPFVEDAHERRLADMEPDVWDAYLQAKKKEYNDRIEAEKQAELERIERERIKKLHQERLSQIIDLGLMQYVREREYGTMSDDEWDKLIDDNKRAKSEHLAEQERIRKENERLQKAKEKAEAERKKREAEIELERQKQQEAIEAERKKREKLEAEQKAREEAELKAKEKAEAERKEAEKAPVKKRLTDWVESFDLPELPGKRHDVCDDIETKFASFKKWAQSQIKEI